MDLAGSEKRPTRWPAATWLRRATSTKRSKNSSSRGNRLNGTAFSLEEHNGNESVVERQTYPAFTPAATGQFPPHLRRQKGADILRSEPEQNPKPLQVVIMQAVDSIALPVKQLTCPDCGARTVQSSACAHCPTCGWGKCG